MDVIALVVWFLIGMGYDAMAQQNFLAAMNGCLAFSMNVIVHADALMLGETCSRIGWIATFSPWKDPRGYVFSKTFV